MAKREIAPRVCRCESGRGGGSGSVGALRSPVGAHPGCRLGELYAGGGRRFDQFFFDTCQTTRVSPTRMRWSSVGWTTTLLAVFVTWKLLMVALRAIAPPSQLGVRCRDTNHMSGASLVLIAVDVARQSSTAVADTVRSAFAGASCPHKVSICLVGEASSTATQRRRFFEVWQYHECKPFDIPQNISTVGADGLPSVHTLYPRHAYVFNIAAGTLLNEGWDRSAISTMRRYSPTNVYTYSPAHCRAGHLVSLPRCVSFGTKSCLPRFAYQPVAIRPRAPIPVVALCPRFAFCRIERWRKCMAMRPPAYATQRDAAFVLSAAYYLSGSDLVAPTRVLTRTSVFPREGDLTPTRSLRATADGPHAAHRRDPACVAAHRLLSTIRRQASPATLVVVPRPSVGPPPARARPRTIETFLAHLGVDIERRQLRPAAGERPTSSASRAQNDSLNW